MAARDDDLSRRVSEIERKLDNGRFVRRIEFQPFIEQYRRDTESIGREFREVQATFARELGRTEEAMGEDIAELKAEIKRDREGRENDRKGIRNLVIAAAFSALIAVAVVFVQAAVPG